VKNKRMGKTTKRTHDEFMSVLNEKFPNITTSDTYINARSKMNFECLIDKYKWSATPDGILRSKGCPKCNHYVKSTYEEFLELFKNGNPKYEDIEILEYRNKGKNNVSCRCKIDGHEWDASYLNLIKGRGCYKCGGTMNLTNDEFLERVYSINSNIEILEEYRNQQTKIKCRCKIDNHEWSTLPMSLLKGHGCPKCSQTKASINYRKTHEQFLEEMKVIHPDYEILDVYKDGKSVLRYKCNVCGAIRKSTANGLLRGDMCQSCFSIARRTSNETFKERLEEKNPDIELVSEYVDSNTKVKVRCKIHGCEWFVLPSNAVRTCGCHICNDTLGEKEVAKVLDKYNIPYNTQYRFEECRNIRPLPFDFYLPDYNTCIEYDGQQHYTPVTFGGCSKDVAEENFINTKKRDGIKDRFCSENNIKLLRIKYDQFNDIDTIIQNFIVK
jgi:hypothetical protein